MAHFIALSIIDRDFIKELNPTLDYGEYSDYVQEVFRIPRADYVCDALMELLDVSWDGEWDFHVMSPEILEHIALGIESHLPAWGEAEQFKAKQLIAQLKEKRETFAFEGDDVLVLNWST